MLLTLTALTLNIFSSTFSPNYRWAIAHSETNGKDMNHLIALPEQRVVTTLKGFSGFDAENHGGIYAMYSKSENVAAVMQSNKWRPRALCLVATATGAQIDLNDRLQSDASTFFKTPSNRQGFIFDVLGAKFDSNRVSFAIIGQTPSDPEQPSVYGSMTYTFTLAKTKITVSKPVMRKITEASAWRWPGIDRW